MSELLKLAERCEKATGPDRELDRLIEETMPDVRRHPYDDMVKDGYVILGPQAYLAPLYTASLDAAVTLVPSNGRLLELGQWQSHGKAGRWFAQVTAWRKTGENSWTDQGYAVGVERPEEALATGALALCAASLRARAGFPVGRMPESSDNPKAKS